MYGDIFMSNNVTIQDIKTGTKADTININIIEIEKAKELKTFLF